MVNGPVSFMPIAGHDMGIITGYAHTIISGGMFVFASGATTNVVNSGLTTFVSSDIKFLGGASGADFIGIATQTVASGAPLAVATKGLFVVQAGVALSSGKLVTPNGNDTFVSGTTFPVGRALTSAGSEGYFIVQLGV